VCVRYRYDMQRRVRYKTVELIVETTPWNPQQRNARREPHDLVAVRIDYSETSLRERIKSAGGIWRHRHKLWEVDWKRCESWGCRPACWLRMGGNSYIHLYMPPQMHISTFGSLHIPVYAFAMKFLPPISR
jgi:hypothetical protein